MLHLILSAAMLPLVVAADAPLDAGTQLVFRGSVEPVGDEGGNGKSFDLTVWILTKNEGGGELFWLVDERGKGEFAWSERFGRVAVDANWRTAAGGPAVLYDRGDGRSVVPIPLPFLVADKPLAADSQFKDGKLDFRVERAAKVGEKPVWRVAGRDAFGPKRTVMVDQQSPLVLAMNEKVIMGRGQEFALKLELVGSEQLAGEPLKALTTSIDKLSALRGKLNQPAQSHQPNWKREQLDLLGQQLPAIAEAATATPLEKLVASAARDHKLQAGLTDAVSGLREKFGGKQVEEFSIDGLAGESLKHENLAGKVTVLHFWEYRDEPLEEPYGQVGYLDFMYHRRKPAGLQLYGVAVDGRLADEQTRPAAERSVRKLKAFMNLSYPVLLDRGDLIKQFGDPRVVGASLPLFVVIGPDSKIVHYHVGHYDVHQDQGLKELDDAVGKAMEKKGS